jgi:hypothetical protein
LPRPCGTVLGGLVLVALLGGRVEAQPAAAPGPAPVDKRGGTPAGKSLAPSWADESSGEGDASAATKGDKKPAATEKKPELDEIERALAADAKDRKAAAGGAGAAAPSEGGDSALSGVVRTFQSLNPDISLITDVALAIFSVDDPLVLGGHDPERTGFNLQAIELALSASVDPYFRFDANIVFGLDGVEVEEAVATSLALPLNLQVRLGEFLTRYGRANCTHPHAWGFVDRPLVLGKLLGPEGNRGLGLEASVLLPLPWYVEVLGSATGAAGEDTARSFYGKDDLGVKSPADFEVTAAIKQFFPLSDNWSLFVGISYATGPNPSGRDNRTEIFGADLYLKYRPITYGSYTQLSLEAEWLLRRRQVPDDVLSDQGMYASVLYRFAKRWTAGMRYEVVTGVETDPLDPAWTGPRHRATGALTFFPTEFSRLRLQYNYDHPSWSRAFHTVVLAAEFAVGAHGAHKF